MPAIGVFSLIDDLQLHILKTRTTETTPKNKQASKIKQQNGKKATTHTQTNKTSFHLILPSCFT